MSWLNDSVTREMSFRGSELAWPDFWRRFLVQARPLLMVPAHFLCAPDPVAYVRFNKPDMAGEIDYTAGVSLVVAPEERRKGYGRRALELAHLLLESYRYLRAVALVKPENVASRNLFRRLGYAESWERNPVEFVKVL